MDTKRHDGDGDDDDDFLEESVNEELYVSDISAELEPIIELVGNWIADEDTEPVQGHPNDLQALQEKLQKQEQLIHLLAKASSSLLHIYYKTKDEQKEESHPQEERLKEEMMQLAFRNSSLQDQLSDLEAQLTDADHRVEDLISDNRRLTDASSSMDASTQAKLKDLQKENNDLNAVICELVSQLKSRERHLASEQQKTKKQMISLQESLELKDAEIAKVEKSKMALRKDIKGLNERLLAIEFEAEELKEELEKNRMKSDFYRFLLEKSEMETAECREMLHEARQRLDDYNDRIGRTRLIRYVQNPNSPYVDPDSLACEIDRVSHRDRHRLTQQATSEYGSTVDDAGSIPCDDISLFGVDCDVIDGCADELSSANCNLQPPMGQPGQPGTFDLDMALDRLNLLQHWKRTFVRRMRPALTYTPHVDPRISRSLYFDCEFSMMTDSLANNSLRSTISFPMQIAFNKSFGGLNNIGRILHSGVLIRGCEAADVIEEVDCSILGLEEDDDVSVKTDDVSVKTDDVSVKTDDVSVKTDDITWNRSSTDSLKSVAWNDSCLSERESGYSSSGRENQMPTLKSKNAAAAIGHFSGMTCSVLHPVHGTVMQQRSSLGKMASQLIASNKRDKLPDCVIS